MKITTARLKEIIKEEIEANAKLRQESLSEITPQMIAQFAWEDGIRIIDFGDPNKEPKLSSDDKKRIAQIIADEAEVEINSWGDATDRNITLDFKNFESKVFSALWHKHKQAAERELPQYNDERIDDGGPYDPAAEEAGY
jgi:hypothetical protein